MADIFEAMARPDNQILASIVSILLNLLVSLVLLSIFLNILAYIFKPIKFISKYALLPVTIVIEWFKILKEDKDNKTKTNIPNNSNNIAKKESLINNQDTVVNNNVIDFNIIKNRNK